MITATFSYDQEDTILSFEITGHAGYADAGEDIVCAAVSVLAIETVNSIEKMANHRMTVKQADEDGGYLFAHVQSNVVGKQHEITQILLKHLYLSLQDVHETYPDYVQLKKKQS